MYGAALFTVPQRGTSKTLINEIRNHTSYLSDFCSFVVGDTFAGTIVSEADKSAYRSHPAGNIVVSDSKLSAEMDSASGMV